MSDSVQPHRRQPTRLPYPWDSPDKNTGVGCHFLLQCRKVKSESEVAQSCPTPSDSRDCSLPGSSVHGIFQARVLEWGAIAFSVTFAYSTIIHWPPAHLLEAFFNTLGVKAANKIPLEVFIQMGVFKRGKFRRGSEDGGFLNGSVVKNPPTIARDAGLIPGWGRFLGGENGNPLQYSCWQDSMDWEAWQATVHGVTKNPTWLSNKLSLSQVFRHSNLHFHL